MNDFAGKAKDFLNKYNIIIITNKEWQKTNYPLFIGFDDKPFRFINYVNNRAF